MITRWGLVACGLLALASIAAWSIRLISYTELVEQSDLIVVAQVTSIERRADGLRIATAELSECLKGTSSNAVQFIASPTWGCDDSNALNGERVVLCLRTASDGQVHIVHSGHGRLPIFHIDGQDVAALLGGVAFPDPMVQTLNRPHGIYTRVIRLDQCKQLIQATVAEQHHKREAEAVK